MSLFRWLGWMLLLVGAGLFTGDVFNLLIFLIGWIIIMFNPVSK